MTYPAGHRKGLWIVAALFAAVACSDTTNPKPEPDIASMRIVVGSGASALTVNVSGSCVASQPISITVNTTTAMTVTFLNAAGQPDPVANDPAIFRLAGNADVPGGPEPAPTPTSIVWARTGPFAGTLRGSVATTSGSVALSALHIDEGHADFGCNVPIVVGP